uniref:Thioesterase domain-containing protein n=1 Tax=Oryza punctata TaxID=4537 RepID=A0A0E0JFY6_ORYPU
MCQTDGVVFLSQSNPSTRRPPRSPAKNQSRARMGGSPAPPPAWMATGARKWLEEAGVAFDGSDRRAFNALPLAGARVSLAEGGRAVCSLRVPAQLTDAEGNWHPGAIAAAADDVCAAAIMSVEGIIKVSVHYDISYFSPAKLHEEVELDGRVVEQKGKMTAVTVEIRKKDSGELVAIGRQWIHQAKEGSSKQQAVTLNQEEVEMDGRVAHRKGKMTAAVVEVRRKASGELVAIGRQWMTSTRARPEKNGGSRSKL